MVNVDECTGVVMVGEWRKDCHICHQCRSYVVLSGQYWLSVKAVNV